MASRTNKASAPSLLQRFGRNQCGTSAVEFAFVVPVFLALTFGAIEFGRVMYSKVAFEYAIMQTTRYGRVAKTTDTSKLKLALGSNLLLLDPKQLRNISINAVVNADKTRTATLSASYQIDFLLPLLETNSITISRSITFLLPN